MRIDFILTWKKVAAALVLAGLLGLLVSWSGIVSISAASGHLPPTRWFLGWTMENAVKRQSLLVEVPADLDLADPALIRRAAGHFATGCSPCHGAPGVAQSPVVEGMTPRPPRLEASIGHWDDRELFWIVENGIKYSGMPPWPAQRRDDEVWAQVAFLRALPYMSGETYAEIALGGGIVEGTLQTLGDGMVESALADCARCHGRDGLGRGSEEADGAFPIIAGQPKAYLYATLLAFREGRRESGFMEPPARRYEPAVLRTLAAHYARQPRPPYAMVAREDPAPADSGRGLLRRASVQDEAGHLEGAGTVFGLAVPLPAPGGPPGTRRSLLELGRRIALEGLRARKIPACESCHGIGDAPHAIYPYLAGQPEWYLSRHLELWRDGHRGGTSYAHVMSEIARHMIPEQIEAVSAWYAERPEQDR